MTHSDVTKLQFNKAHEAVLHALNNVSCTQTTQSSSMLALPASHRPLWPTSSLLADRRSPRSIECHSIKLNEI